MILALLFPSLYRGHGFWFPPDGRQGAAVVVVWCSPGVLPSQEGAPTSRVVAAESQGDPRDCFEACVSLPEANCIILYVKSHEAKLFISITCWMLW